MYVVCSLLVYIRRINRCTPVFSRGDDCIQLCAVCIDQGRITEKGIRFRIRAAFQVDADLLLRPLSTNIPNVCNAHLIAAFINARMQAQKLRIRFFCRFTRVQRLRPLRWLAGFYRLRIHPFCCRGCGNRRTAAGYCRLFGGAFMRLRPAS